MKTTAFEENTHGVRKFHLSLTGTRAGLILCGIDQLAEAEQSFHAVYAPDAVFCDPRLCPQCKEAWEG